MVQENSKEDRAQKEALVEQYIAGGNSDQAVKLLFELIVAYAGEKNFSKAEALNEKLYEADPLAVTEIVRAAEAIEEAKKQSLDPKHLEIWSRLYESLSTEEKNALYYAMESRDFEAGEVIMEQAAVCSRLYFINKGEVKAVFAKDNQETFVKTLKTGDVLGHETFFSASVATVSFIALTGVKTSRLHSDTLKKWKNSVPLLESKLYEFCKKKDWMQQRLMEGGLERRRYSRVAVNGTLGFQLLNSADKPLGKSYKGEIADISAGGVSFLVKSSRPDTVRMLLGRRMRIRIELPLKGGADKLETEQTGRVTAVQSQGFDDFSIHLEFDRELSKAEKDKISRDARS